MLFLRVFLAKNLGYWILELSVCGAFRTDGPAPAARGSTPDVAPGDAASTPERFALGGEGARPNVEPRDYVAALDVPDREVGVFVRAHLFANAHYTH